MTFAERYKSHAFHDLIEEAEKQGIDIGVQREQQRIMSLLKDTFGTLGIQKQIGSYVFATDFETLIKKEQK